MSETRMRKSARWRRAQTRNGGKSPTARAVSPVVATLILILIAVAAAAALYLWLVDWQHGITNGIGTQSAQPSLLIGGSTSVYPFDVLAVAQFQQNHSDVAVSDSQGGTGAGMLAVCHGQIDIGTSSTLQTVSGLETSDACPSTTVITTVAYDAVDIIVPGGNTHNLLSISWDTLNAIYDGASSSAPTSTPSTYNGVTVTAGLLDVAPFSTHAALTWNQVPACVDAAPVCGGVTTAGALPVGLATGIGVGAACTGNPALICESGAGNTPCGFTICAGGANNPITTVARSDASGTTQSFEARLLAFTSSTAYAGTAAGLTYSGCGSNNLISDCGLTATKTASGNPAVISTVAAAADSIGYASDGLARATGSGVSIVAFLGPAQTTAAVTGYSNGGILPTTGSGGTISSGCRTFLNSGPSNGAPAYVGVRPFEYVTTTTPTGEANVFLTYVLDPANNQNLASESQEVSVYSV